MQLALGGIAHAGMAAARKGADVARTGASVARVGARMGVRVAGKGVALAGKAADAALDSVPATHVRTALRELQENVESCTNAFYRDHGKRALDVAIAAGSLAVFAVPMVVAAAAIKIDDPTGPVIFKQERLGLGGRTFNMYKFRSMCVGAESQGSGVYSGAGDTRVTRVGYILRKTSADELPQLVNMLKGDMSLIGPRPPLTYHPWPLDQYTPQQRRMFDVRPGLTGWAQIHGRRTVEWNQRIEYNVWYVDHLSPRLDAEIFLRTFAKIASSEDNENTSATAAAPTAAATATAAAPTAAAATTAPAP